MSVFHSSGQPLTFVYAQIANVIGWWRAELPVLPVGGCFRICSLIGQRYVFGDENVRPHKQDYNDEHPMLDNHLPGDVIEYVVPPPGATHVAFIDNQNFSVTPGVLVD